MSIAVPATARAERHAVPTERVETPLADPLLYPDVQKSYVKVHHPLGSSYGTHPEACDWIGYLRYRHKDGPAESRDAAAVLTLQPGLLIGAAAYGVQGNQVVHKAGEQGKYVEYWALDRRSNCAEDHTGYDAAKRAKNADIAADYYLSGKPVDGRTFSGYTGQLSLPYLADFGMAMTLDDWRAVIEQAMPTPKDRGKVFCGGHSYGAFLIGGMLSWDFDGRAETQDDAGYNICGGGAFALEGLAMNDPVGLHAMPLFEVFVKLLGGMVGQNAVNAGYKSGLVPRTLDLPPVVNLAKLTNTIQMAGLAAAFAPKQETRILKVASSQLDMQVAMRGLFAPDPVAFGVGAPGPGTYRLTGEAAFGTMFDNNSNWMQVFQANLGFYDGKVTERTWPAPNLIVKVPILGQIWAHGFGIGHLYAPADQGRLYGWRNYDEVGDLPRSPLGEAPTTPAKEVTDIRQLAGAAAAEGPADFFDWYFPTRQLSDLIFAYGLGRTGDLANLIYQKEGLKKRPILTVLGGEGPIQNVALGNIVTGLVGVGDLVPKDRLLIPGYRHFDVVTAAAKQNNGQPEQASAALTGFALMHAH